MVSVKNEQIEDHISDPFSFKFSQVFCSHSDIEAQFFTTAIIPAIAAATPAMIAMIGSNGTSNAVTANATAAIAGASAENVAISTPRITTKFCTGSGIFPKYSPACFSPAAIGGMISFASFIMASPSGTRLCSNSLMLAVNV